MGGVGKPRFADAHPGMRVSSPVPPLDLRYWSFREKLNRDVSAYRAMGAAIQEHWRAMASAQLQAASPCHLAHATSKMLSETKRIERGRLGATGSETMASRGRAPTALAAALPAPRPTAARAARV